MRIADSSIGSVAVKPHAPAAGVTIPLRLQCMPEGSKSLNSNPQIAVPACREDVLEAVERFKKAFGKQ